MAHFLELTLPPWIACRKVATPDDLDDPAHVKAEGVVELPIHIDWSYAGPFDLDDEAQRRWLYELVLTEGNEDDVRFYIRLDKLLEMWETIWLSQHVVEAWEAWFDRRGITR